MHSLEEEKVNEREAPQTAQKKRVRYLVQSGVAITVLSAGVYAWSAHHAYTNGRSMGDPTISSSNNESDFASAKYTPVERGAVNLLIDKTDFNHKNTGRQGVLVETLLDFDPDSGPSNPSGYHFFLYSPRVHPSVDGTAQCDLKTLLTDPSQQPYQTLMLDVSGEGFIRAERIATGNNNYRGFFPGRGCDLVITGVHSFGTIPQDVWDRTDALWQQEEQKALAERAKASE